MKKIYGFAALSAAMLLASCSNNDEPTPALNGQGEVVETGYIAVNLAVPAQTRTFADDASISLESEVNNVKFVVFDENKELICATEPLTDFTWGTDPDAATDGPHDCDIMTQQIVPIPKKIKENGSEVTLNKVAYVMAVLNCPDTTTFSGFNRGAALEKVREHLMKVNRTSLGEAGSKKNYFIMTNSAYGAKETINGVETDYNAYATSFRDKVYDDIFSASKSPVNIYVERLAARVDIKKGKDANNQPFKTKGIESAGIEYNATTGLNEDITLSVELTGVDFIYATKHSYLVKNIENVASSFGANTDATSLFTAWDKDAYRTHWGVSPSLTYYPSTDTKNKDKSGYDQLTYAAATTSGKYGNALFADGDDNTYNFYLNENLSALPTYVCVTGKIKKKTLTGTEELTDNVYQLWQTGKFYTEPGAKNVLLTYLRINNYKYKCEDSDVDTDKTYQDVRAEDAKFVACADASATGHTDADAHLQLKSEITVNNRTYYLYKGTEKQTGTKLNAKWADTDASNNALRLENDMFKGYRYANNQTYYYCPIKPNVHENTVYSELYWLGVVRNHRYDITFNSIQGLGTPLYNPDGDLLPKEITTNEEGPKWYFNCGIHILSWKVYSQGIDFGK